MQARPEGTFKLTKGQAKHAKDMLKKVPQLDKLRYSLCPTKMNEETFWRYDLFCTYSERSEVSS